MVSLVAQPEIPLAIFLHHQALKFVSSCRALCQALLWSASSVSCSSSEDDPLESLGGVFSLGLGWHRFCQPDWIFSPGSDSESVSLCIPRTWLTPVRVSWIGGCPCPSLPSDAAWPSLKTSTSPLLALAFSSSQGSSSSLWESSKSLLDSLLPSVTWEWAEPDHRLWNEVILQAWLHDRSLEPHGPPNPMELLETARDRGQSTPSLGWWVTLSNTLDRVQDVLTSLQSGQTLPCLGCHLL